MRLAVDSFANDSRLVPAGTHRIPLDSDRFVPANDQRNAIPDV